MLQRRLALFDLKRPAASCSSRSTCRESARLQQVFHPSAPGVSCPTSPNNFGARHVGANTPQCQAAEPTVTDSNSHFGWRRNPRVPVDSDDPFVSIPKAFRRQTTTVGEVRRLEIAPAPDLSRNHEVVSIGGPSKSLNGVLTRVSISRCESFVTDNKRSDIYTGSKPCRQGYCVPVI